MVIFLTKITILSFAETFLLTSCAAIEEGLSSERLGSLISIFTGKPEPYKNLEKFQDEHTDGGSVRREDYQALVAKAKEKGMILPPGFDKANSGKISYSNITEDEFHQMLLKRQKHSGQNYENIIKNEELPENIRNKIKKSRDRNEAASRDTGAKMKRQQQIIQNKNSEKRLEEKMKKAAANRKLTIGGIFL